MFLNMSEQRHGRTRMSLVEAALTPLLLISEYLALNSLVEETKR